MSGSAPTGAIGGRRVTRVLGARFPDRVVGVSTRRALHPRQPREPETPEEREYLERVECVVGRRDRLPANPGDQAADAGLRSVGFPGRAGRVDHREAAVLE